MILKALNHHSNTCNPVPFINSNFIILIFPPTLEIYSYRPDCIQSTYVSISGTSPSTDIVWLNDMTCKNSSYQCLNHCFKALHSAISCSSNKYVSIQCTYDVAIANKATSGSEDMCTGNSGGGDFFNGAVVVTAIAVVAFLIIIVTIVVITLMTCHLVTWHNIGIEVKAISQFRTKGTRCQCSFADSLFANCFQ